MSITHLNSGNKAVQNCPLKKRARKIGWIVNNSAANCSILLKCGTESDHPAVDTLQMFRVKGSEVNITASSTASAVKTL